MLKNISIFSILFILLINASNAQLISKKEFRLKESRIHSIELIKDYKHTSKSSVSKNKSPLLAGTLSFIVPGAALGQFYKEEYINGGIRVGISAICIVWFFVSPTFDFGGGGDASQKFLATLLYTANWLVSVIDAIIPAKYFNNKYRKNFHSF